MARLVADQRRRPPSTGLNAAGLGLRLIGSIIGLFVLMFSAPFAYGLFLQGWQVLTVVYGPETVLLWIGGMQYAGYALMGVLLFRYLSRLGALRFSLRDAVNVRSVPRAAVFWLTLTACLLFANIRPHLTGLSLPTLTLDVVLIGLLLYHYSGARLISLGDSIPLVLFLRPFSSFSDRSLVNGLLNALPLRTQVVFLVSRQEPVSNWDPYTIGLAGFRFLEPVRSTPISLVCDDDEWIQCVRHLIAKSALVVVDVSTMTPSLKIELGLLQETGASSRTLFLS